MSNSVLWFIIFGFIVVAYLLWLSVMRKDAGESDIADTKGTQGSFVGWFEEFGVAMVRGTNVLIFIVIIFAGIVICVQSMADNNVLLAVLSLCGAFLTAGLVTGVLSMIAQIYEAATISRSIQIEILKELRSGSRD